MSNAFDRAKQAATEGDCLARAVLEASDRQVTAWVCESTGDVSVERYKAIPTGEASATVVPAKVRQKRMRHMGVSKAVLIRGLRAYGTDEIMPGRTVEEAVAEVEADPREIFTGCDCQKASDGSCLGAP